MRGMSAWQMRQANDCLCGGSDEYCPCQNVERMAAADRQVDEIMAMPDSEVLALKPCPFCAQSVVGPIPNPRARWSFHCRGCGAVIELNATTQNFAEQNWNNRVQNTPTLEEADHGS